MKTHRRGRRPRRPVDVIYRTASPSIEGCGRDVVGAVPYNRYFSGFLIFLKFDAVRFHFQKTIV